MDIEEKIIKNFSSNNKYIGDDCAYLEDTKQLISTDSIAEYTHFDVRKFTAMQIAHRLFVSNFSDIQSSGGEPKYALFNISFPKKKSILALSISKHLRNMIKKNKITIIGGDTTSSKDIFLSLTLISKKIDRSKVILRSKSKVNDEIYLFKNIGFSKLGFLNLYQNLDIPSSLRKKSLKQFLHPKFYKYFDIFNKLPINSSMDISDSLYITIKEMARLSNKKFVIDNLSSVNPSLSNNLNYNKYMKLILSSGEEYVPVFTMKKNNLRKNTIALFKKRGIEIVKIGNVKRGKGIVFQNYNTKNIYSYNHFSENYLKL